MTHNTANCNKYKKNRFLKPNYKKSGSQTGSKLNQNFAQVLKEGFAKMTKILKDKKTIRNAVTNTVILTDSLGGVVQGT